MGKRHIIIIGVILIVTGIIVCSAYRLSEVHRKKASKTAYNVED